MNFNISNYSYTQFKPNFDDAILTDLVKGSRTTDQSQILEGYVLPKEFAARLSLKMGHEIIVFPYRDVPLTNRNLIESHLFTKCILLEPSASRYHLLLKVYNSIGEWGALSEVPTTYAHFSMFIQDEYLDLLGDRIRYIPSGVGVNYYIATGAILKACGVSSKELFKNIINYIQQTTGFKYQRNIVNFLKSHLEVEVTPRGFRFQSNAARVRCVSNFTPATTDHEQIARFLFAIYFNQYSQWSNSGSWVEVEGDKVYVDHHTVYEVGGFRDYLQKNRSYPNQLPFGIHPSKYFHDRIVSQATKSHRSAAAVTYPKKFKGYVDLTNSPHRQLLTGLDLVNEGVYMKHCVGGENYQRSMASGRRLYFHLDLPGVKHGATLSMESTFRYKDAYLLNDEWWEVEQYYGYDDEDAHDGIGGEVLQEFLKQHFIPYNRYAITEIDTTVSVKSPDNFVYTLNWANKLRRWNRQLADRSFGLGYGLDSLAARVIPSNGVDVEIELSPQAIRNPLNFGTMAYSPEILGNYAGATMRPEYLFASTPARNPDSGLYDLYNEMADSGYQNGSSIFYAGSRVFEPDTTGVEVSLTRTCRSIDDNHAGALKPITLIPKHRRNFTVYIDGRHTTTGTHAHPLILKVGQTLKVLTHDKDIRVHVRVVEDIYTLKPNVDAMTLGVDECYINNSGVPQAIALYLVTEVKPAKIPLHINHMFYPSKQSKNPYEILHRPGSSVLHSHQSLGRLFRTGNTTVN